MNIDIEDITLKVYRAMLDNDSGAGAADRQVAEYGDKKQQRWSLIYRPTVIETLIQLGLYKRHLPPQHVKKNEKIEHEENNPSQ